MPVTGLSLKVVQNLIKEKISARLEIWLKAKIQITLLMQESHYNIAHIMPRLPFACVQNFPSRYSLFLRGRPLYAGLYKIDAHATALSLNVNGFFFLAVNY